MYVIIKFEGKPNDNIGLTIMKDVTYWASKQTTYVANLTNRENLDVTGFFYDKLQCCRLCLELVSWLIDRAQHNGAR